MTEWIFPEKSNCHKSVKQNKLSSRQFTPLENNVYLRWFVKQTYHYFKYFFWLSFFKKLSTDFYKILLCFIKWQNNTHLYFGLMVVAIKVFSIEVSVDLSGVISDSIDLSSFLWENHVNVSIYVTLHSKQMIF